MHKKIFFSPMSINLSDGVKKALIENEICHREPEFTVLLNKVRRKILNTVKGNEKFSTIILTGSGTAALDSVLNSLQKNDLILIVNNGTYGERIVKIAKRYNLNFKEIKFEGYPNLQQIENELQNKSISHLAFTHHETSTGMINPLTEIGELCKRYNKSLIVDAISSIAVQKLDIVTQNISFLIGSSNKGIGGAEGLSFVVAQKTELEKIKNSAKGFYLDLYANYNKEEKGQTLFTPAVRILSGLNTALDELNEEEIINRINRFKEISILLRDGLKKLGFNILTDLRYASNVVTLVDLGSKSFEELHKKVYEKDFVIYRGKDNQTFRLCTFGDIHKSDIIKFLKVLEEEK